MTYYSYQKFLLHLCNLHNEVFGGPQARINTECFLPTREGVSPSIATANAQALVSSLHGRVYRAHINKYESKTKFPPYTGGCIGRSVAYTRHTDRFPPYTGGCIIQQLRAHLFKGVSSLHGRVYR